MRRAGGERAPATHAAGMASRDLTRKFVEWRSNRPRSAAPTGLPRAGRVNSREDRALVAGYASDASDMETSPEPVAPAGASLPPVWVDIVERVEGDVFKIEKAVRDLSGLHTSGCCRFCCSRPRLRRRKNSPSICTRIRKKCLQM